MPLTGLDGVFLDLETPATPMHVGSLHFFDAPAKDKPAFEKLSDGKNKPWEPITHQDYLPTIEMVKYVDSLRKGS